MEPKYVLILDFFVGCLNIIRLTDEELRESENYENSCQWMTTENLDIYCYQNGEETELNLL